MWAQFDHRETNNKRMRRIVIIALFCLFGLTVFGQKGVNISYGDRVVGKNHLVNKDIVAKEALFPERIHDFYYDSVSNCLTVQLRGTSKNGKWLNNKGHIALYDLTQNKIKWSKKISYQQSGIEQHNNLIIQTIQNKSYCLDFETGNNKWEIKNSIYYVDPYQNIGIGYRNDSFSGASNTVEGIDLQSGAVVWQRQINREYGWNDILHLNDSTIIIVASGLHLINVRNGTGWDYHTITGQKDYTANVATNVAGVALGVLTGTFVTTTGHDLIREVVSNVWLDSASVYIASREKLTRLNHRGDIIWTTPLDKSLMSKSSIFVSDSTLFMVNRGYAFMGYRQLNYGSPFFATFDINTGKQRFLNIISKKKDPISYYRTDKDVLLVVFKNRILKYSMSDGALINERLFDVETSGELKFFIGNDVYQLSDSTFHSITSSGSKSYFVYTEKGYILEVDNNFEVLNQIYPNSYYVYYFKTENFKFLDMGEVTAVIDNENNQVATLDISRRTIRIGSKIFFIQGSSLVGVELDDITIK